MLVSASSLSLGPIEGVSFLIQKNWLSTSTNRAERILRDISIHYARIAADSKATKAFVKDLESPQLNDLHASVEMSLKQHGLSSRNSLDQVSIFARSHTGHRDQLLLKNHHAFQCSLEDEDGEIFLISTPKEQNSKLGWHIVDLKNIGKTPFINLHVSPLTQKTNPQSRRLGNLDSISHFILSDLAQRSSTPFSVPSYIVPL